jgi:hypothetical protein
MVVGAQNGRLVGLSARGAGLIYNEGLSIVGNSGNVGEVLHLEQGQSAGIGRRAIRMAAAAGIAAFVGVMAGCGNTYRPVLATIGAVGPAGQPPNYAVVVSSPTPVGSPCPAAGQPTSNGLLTIADFSGDTVLVTATLGTNPYYLALSPGGTTGYTLNCDKTVNSFEVSTRLISSEVLESTLPAGTNPASLFATQSATYISDPGVGVNSIDQLNGRPPALKQQLPVPAGYSPIYMVGNSSAARLYEINQANSGGPGQVETVEIVGNTISGTIPVGRGPVYGVMSLDTRRVFILNQTDGTVSVINSQTNMLDTPLNTIPVGPRPVWAELASGLDELVVVNEGNGTTPGSVSIVSVPLCSLTALPTNPNCNAANPIDATTFGQVVKTIPVGINPIMVTVLADYTRAYVANAGVAGLPCAAIAVPGVSTTCTVSVVNLLSNTVTATIPIAGHPVYIASADSTPTGKVYVVCNDSQVMTVIQTDKDVVDLTIPIQGYGVSVRMTSQ